MNKPTKDQLNAHDSLMESFEDLRGLLDLIDSAELIIFMLMWAKYIPQTHKETIGYFDFILEANLSKYIALLRSMSPPSKAPLEEKLLLLLVALEKFLFKLSVFVRSIILQISSGGHSISVSGY